VVFDALILCCPHNWAKPVAVIITVSHSGKRPQPCTEWQIEFARRKSLPASKAQVYCRHDVQHAKAALNKGTVVALLAAFEPGLGSGVGEWRS